jgi:hypothetical protein
LKKPASTSPSQALPTLESVGERNRRIAVDLSLGERTRDLADRYGTTQGRISQLRREFHDDWRRFTGADL